MVIFAERSVLLESGVGRNVELTSDNGFDPGFFAAFIKVDDAVHNSVVCYSHGIMTHLQGNSGDIGDAARTVEKTVFTVQMQVNKSFSHCSENLPWIYSFQRL